MTAYLTQRQCSAAKSRLTRAINSGDHQRVLDEVRETYARWDAGDYAYPDGWARWQRAAEDAALALRYQL